MLRKRFSEDLKSAMKSKDSYRVSTLRLILAALKERDIAARGEGREDGVSDDEILEMLNKMLRQRTESIRLYEQGGRLELAEQEAHEIDIIRGYLPPQMDDAEIDRAVRAVISEIDARSVKDMGRTMATLKREYAGRMDFSKASGLVKEHLTGAIAG